MPHVGSRVLTLLQFTRAALVFTALADCLTALLLHAQRAAGPHDTAFQHLSPRAAVLALSMSACLYAFGMALNDLVDRRRDSLLAAARPIPSGRMPLSAAHGVVAALLVAALAFGSALAALTGSLSTLVLLLGTLALIIFYNLAGKYLVSAGIVSLGLVRLTHACIAAPDLPVIWHGLWLFTHIVIVSTVAYILEEKRPRLTPVHSATLVLAAVAINIAAVATVLCLRLGPEAHLSEITRAVALSPGLLAPLTATAGFVVLAARITRAAHHPRPGKFPPPPLRERRRRAGQQLMLTGLLWLIVYDAAFAFGYVSPLAGLLILAFLPLAYGAVRLMRGWASLILLAKEPEFRQARTL